MVGGPDVRGRVAVVTDSTAHLTRQEADELGVAVVPLEVIIAGRAGLDDIEVDSAQVAQALRDWEPVSTSRPAPARFVAAYEDARHAGATAVVSVHLSGVLSGTVDAARLAAGEASLPVTVVDSRQIGLGFGFAVLDAARRAAAGAEATEVAAVATARARSASTVFYVDTLEYLRRGGRIGAASAFLGNVLAVKPLLDVVDGHIEPLEKVRTSARALGRLVDLAVVRADGRPVDLGVHHLDSPQRAEHAAALLAQRVPQAGPVRVRELGAVIGAHVGPGVVAVVVAPSEVPPAG